MRVQKPFFAFLFGGFWMFAYLSDRYGYINKKPKPAWILGFSIKGDGIKLGHSKRNVQISYRRLDGGAGGNRTHVRKSLDMTFSGCSMSTKIPDRNLRHTGYLHQYSFCSWQSQRITNCSRWPLILCLGGAVALTAQTIRQRRCSLRCYKFAIISV